MALLEIRYNIGNREVLALCSMELSTPGDLTKLDEHPVLLGLRRVYETHYERHGYGLHLPSVRLVATDGDTLVMYIEAAFAAWRDYGLAGVTLRALGGMQEHGQLLSPEIVVTVATHVWVHGDDGRRQVWKCRPGSDVGQDADFLGELLYAALRLSYLQGKLTVNPLIKPMRDKTGVNFIRILVDADGLSEASAIVTRILEGSARMLHPEDSR